MFQFSNHLLKRALADHLITHQQTSKSAQLIKKPHHDISVLYLYNLIISPPIHQNHPPEIFQTFNWKEQ